MHGPRKCNALSCCTRPRRSLRSSDSLALDLSCHLRSRIRLWRRYLNTARRLLLLSTKTPIRGETELRCPVLQLLRLKHFGVSGSLRTVPGDAEHRTDRGSTHREPIMCEMQTSCNSLVSVVSRYVSMCVSSMCALAIT